MVTIHGVAYHLASAGQGEPLLLLHGFSGSSANWAGQQALLAREYRAMAVDLLGHGRTAAPSNPARYQMEEAAADLALLLQEQAAVPAHLVGYSMGGRLALYLALTRPHLVKSLSLESASPGLKTAAEQEQRQQQDNELADFIEREGVPAFVARWERLPLWNSQAQLGTAGREKVRQQRLQNNPLGLANSLRGMGSGVQPSLWPRLNELTMPVLLIAGELDQKFVAINREMAAAIPQAQLAIVGGAGHTIHLEQPEKWRQVITAFTA